MLFYTLRAEPTWLFILTAVVFGASLALTIGSSMSMVVGLDDSFFGSKRFLAAMATLCLVSLLVQWA